DVSILFEFRSHAKDVTVRVPQVHLTKVPRHVGRRKSHFDIRGDALAVNFVDVVHGHAQPRAFFPSSTLPVDAEKNLAFAGLHRSKVRRRSHSHAFFQPHFSNQVKLAARSVTLRTGVTDFAFMIA